VVPDSPDCSPGPRFPFSRSDRSRGFPFLTGTRGTAFIVFADGSMHEMRINDQSSLVRAQADAVRFNALAPAYGGQAAQAATSVQASPGHALDQQSSASHLADELTQLAGLHASGVLTDAEFQAAEAKLLGTLAGTRASQDAARPGEALLAACECDHAKSD